MDRSPAIYFLVSMLVCAAAVATPYAATDITFHIVRRSFPERARAASLVFEPQSPNWAAKKDRAALLNDSPSYTNFDASLLRLALSRVPSQKSSNGFLNEAQIASLESRLRLNSQQAPYWPPVADALRSVGRQYFQTRDRARSIPLDSSEVKQLIAAAVPLIAHLTENQKREARQLLRIIGLEGGASEI